MCSIVAAAAHDPRLPPSSPSASPAPDILWRDDNFTIYREHTYPVSSKGHLIIVFKCVFAHHCIAPADPPLAMSSLHVPSLYNLVRLGSHSPHSQLLTWKHTAHAVLHRPSPTRHNT